ncbi:MAG: 3-methyl-2-oxobutanoate hydroxymethyltransferase, partial [Chitinivibrionales bacterium]|nr:3-methyl-2-oxobutanoate hydroxymethyltransferase [Chitinivibrionales bacterium]
GVVDSFLLCDLPYRSYETAYLAVENSRRFIDAGADAVKLEGCRPEIVRQLVMENITVVGHIGLNPQYHQQEMKQGIIVHGKTHEEAIRLIEAALSLERAGIELLILEKIPFKVSRIITENVAVPTIGIGAGRYCDGQVLIIHDCIGFTNRHFKHVKQYANINEILKDACNRYSIDVSRSIFPDESHSNSIKEEELRLVHAWAAEKGLAV